MRSGNKNILLILSLVLLALSFIIGGRYSNTNKVVDRFKKVLEKKEKEVYDHVSTLAANLEKESFDALFQRQEEYANLFKEKGFVYLIYKSDSLKFWSDNSVPVENYLNQVCLDNSVIKLNNGWFEVIRKDSHSGSVIGLILIKTEFPYHNQFLADGFQKDFAVPASAKIVTDASAKGFQISTSRYLFTLFLPGDAKPYSLLAAFLFVIGILLLIWWLDLFLQSIFRERRSLSVLSFAALLIIFRVALHYYRYPAVLFNLELFQPSLYAHSAYIPSLGDLIINVLVLFILVFKFYQLPFKIKKPLFAKTALILGVLLLLLFSLFIIDIHSSLVIDSKIILDINDLLSLSIYSYLSIITLGVLFLILFVFIKKFYLIFRQGKEVLLISFSVFLILGILISFYYYENFAVFLLLLLPVFCLQGYFSLFNMRLSFLRVIVLILILSVFSVCVLERSLNVKEENNRKIIAENLATERDPVAEYLFKDLSKGIERDTILSSLLHRNNFQPENFLNRLRRQYFTGYWEKYDFNTYVFDTLCTTILKPAVAEAKSNLVYFEEKVLKQCVPTASPGLFFLEPEEASTILYIARIPIKWRELSLMLYIELRPKLTGNETGYPSLLLDEEIQSSYNLTSYSYAFYLDGKLTRYHGNYSYNFSSATFKNHPNGFYKFNSFSHYIYKANRGITVIVSKPLSSIFNSITTFSYLFTCYSLLLLVGLMIYHGLRNKNFFKRSFSNSVQLTLVSIIAIALGILGFTTIYFMERQYQNEAVETIKDKTQSVLLELQDKLGEEEELKYISIQYLPYILSNLSNIFNADINLYNLNGDLVATSQPKVFEQGLVSKKMNSLAYFKLAINQQVEFIHQEQIGKLNYLSAYVPFFNESNKIIGYLNLPYFSRQDVLEEEVSSFLVTLINIYVLLFAVSILSAILLSSYVTKPLKLLSVRLGNLKYGKDNESIYWDKEDEIGNLVNEYNRMLKELSKSADLLARSERESAWREMAKQVAHEIKNPLTPMKLSIQHLERAYTGNSPDAEERRKRIITTLIEQIDSLSDIANAFGDFAKMPKTSLEKINLDELLKNTVELFASEEVQVELIKLTYEPLFVYADKAQLLRVFNNLLKNSIQAIPHTVQGKVELIASSTKDNVLIEVKDNGEGIDEELKDKIFMPNFTTKSSGTGLGLAMVKNIIETFEGKIWFESVREEGTSFYIELPKL